MKFQIILLIALSCSVSSRNDDDDESRPYEFGFTIDGQQHRHESKDVNGIVMGEFGFITADGIYHVTVYATDENGNFKILSMRNIRVSGPLDEPGYEFPKKTPGTGQTHEKLIAAPEPQLIVPTTTQAPTTNFKAPYVFTTLPSLNVPACSSCKLPSTTPRPAGQQKDNKFPFQTPAFQDKSHLGGPPQLPPQQSPPQPPQQFPQQFPQQPPQQFPQQFPQQPPQQFPQLPPQQPPKPIQPEYDIDRRYGGLENFDDTNGKLPENYEPIQPSIEQQPPLEKPKTPVFENINNVPNTFRQGKEIAVAEKIQNAPEFTPETNPPIGINPNVDVFQPVKPSLPITVSEKQINIPGRDPISIKDPYPNMVDGLPAGITENDMLDLLYKFNYTLGFHGHHEKGLKNGAKVGAYFVNGRDGISRVVEYIADENGYRPKVRFINLGLDSPDTPKEGTEKTFGLKGFEFTWYPI